MKRAPVEELARRAGRVARVLDDRCADAGLGGRLGVVPLALAVDLEQVRAGLGDAHDDLVVALLVVAGHLEVDVGQPAGELLDRASTARRSRDLVELRRLDHWIRRRSCLGSICPDTPE